MFLEKKDQIENYVNSYSHISLNLFQFFVFEKSRDERINCLFLVDAHGDSHLKLALFFIYY